MRGRPIVVETDVQATETIAVTAAAAHPHETGGLLLGWWDTDRIVVRFALEVRDGACQMACVTRSS